MYQHRQRGAAQQLVGHAAQEQSFQPSAAVRLDGDQIEIGRRLQDGCSRVVKVGELVAVQLEVKSAALRKDAPSVLPHVGIFFAPPLPTRGYGRSRRGGGTLRSMPLALSPPSPWVKRTA